MNIPVEVGRICRSKSGRDKGRYFVILDRAEGDYVYIVDGMLRKMAKPKRKKLKHLELTHDKAEAIEMCIRDSPDPEHGDGCARGV